MKQKDILEYYKSWGGNPITFTEMLMKKAYFAKVNGKKVMAYKEMRTGAELEKMFGIADDMACKGLLK